MEYFTSDWHLGHDRIRELCKRPHNSVEEMDKDILNKFFDTVDIHDTVYYLGDLGWKGDVIENFIKSIWEKGIFNFKFIWILGNHDLKFKEFILNLVKKYSYLEVYDSLLDIIIDDQPITLCHYPMITWNKSHFGAWQLYGHHHQDYSGDFKYIRDNFNLGKQYNVACDMNEFNLFSFKEIKLHMDHQNDNWDFLSEKSQDRLNYTKPTNE